MDDLISKKGDTIYRADAIDALCKAGCGSEYCGISCDDVKAIEDLPSAQPSFPCCHENDCISRAEAIDAMEESKKKYFDRRVIIGKMQDIVNNLPSAQSELIRCGDCKHSEHWYRDKARCFLWHEDGIDVFEDGYCNYAERKEGADG